MNKENQPKLLIGQVVEIKNLTYEMRIYINNQNALEQVNSMIKNGDKLMKVWDNNGKIIWEKL